METSDESVQDVTVQSSQSSNFSRSNPDFIEECRTVANDVTTEKRKLLEVILELQPLFTSSLNEERANGVHALSTIISFLNINKLSESEFMHISDFYKGRLNDHQKLIPDVLTGILALSTYTEEAKGVCFTGMLTTMFQTVSCQAQPYQERLKIYKIFQTMLRSRTKELLDLGPDFVYGVISAIDGEREPRNLIFVFEWLPEFINTVNLGHLAEEMFDIVSCYFPVDFRVPIEEANGISRDALAQALTPCLCASNEFAEQAVQLALEKLVSDLQIAKLDSLQLLLMGCKKFSLNVFIECKTLWTTFQRELLKMPSTEVETLLLQTITELSRKLSTDHQNFVYVFENVIEMNTGNLVTTGKFFTPTCKLFLAMSKANEKCAQRILTNIQPSLLSLFNISSSLQQKETLLKVLTEYIKIGDEFNVNVREIPYFLLTIFAKNDEGLQALALIALCFINRQFDDVKMMMLEQWGRLFSVQLSKDTQKAFHDCILHYTPRCVKEIVILIESQPINYALLDNLCSLSSREPFITEFCKHFLQTFEKQPKICLGTLSKALRLHQNETFYKSIAEMNIIERILTCGDVHGLDIEDFVNIKECLMQIIASYTIGEQEMFVNRHLQVVLDRFRQELNENNKIVESGNEMDCGEVRMKSIYFVYGILVCLNLENMKNCEIIDDLFALSCRGDKRAVELLANVINKLPEDVIRPFVRKFEEFLKAHMQSMSEEEIRHCGIVVVWLTKALVMRGYEEKSKWIKLFIEFLQHTNIIAHNGMKTIMSDDCKSLSLFTHCRRRLLYKQQFFTEICPMFVDKATDNYMLAFACLLKEVPGVLLTLNFEKIIRLIMMCLDSSTDATGIIPILSTIRNILEAGDALGEQYLDDFLPRLLRLSKFERSMNVRILALQCLGLYISEMVPMHKLMKHKNVVTDELGKCIDDKKRLVRKEAADTRMKWFLLNAPI